MSDSLSHFIKKQKLPPPQKSPKVEAKLQIDGWASYGTTICILPNIHLLSGTGIERYSIFHVGLEQLRKLASLGHPRYL